MSTASVGWCGCGIGDGFLVGWVVIMGECPLGFVPCEDVGEEWSGSVGFGCRV